MRSVVDIKKSHKGIQNIDQLLVDAHAHILPQLDNGPENMNEAIDLCKKLKKFGFRKIIATPHIMSKFYDNNEEAISLKTKILAGKLLEEGIDLALDYGAEYYLDDAFTAIFENDQKPITLGRNTNYVLLETAFIEKYYVLSKTIDLVREAGYRIVLAHPERYVYLDELEFEKLQNKGVLFQLNINSLNGMYSKQAKRKAEFLVKHDMVSLLGSNVHKDLEAESLDYVLANPYYQLALKSGRLLNNSLL